MELQQFRDAAAQANQGCQSTEKQLTDCERRLRDMKSSIDNLQLSQSDRLDKFGKHMPDLVAKIKQNERKFSKLPIGPIGAYFDLTDYKWAFSIEQCFKGLIYAFVCNDYDDEKVLLKICKDVCQIHGCNRPTIIISKFFNTVHNTELTRCKTKQHPCVLDIIQCENPVIMNALIDQRAIEKIALIENSNEAVSFMKTNKPAISNIRECFTISGDQMFSEPTFRYYACSSKSHVRVFIADARQQIKNVRSFSFQS